MKSTFLYLLAILACVVSFASTPPTSAQSVEPVAAGTPGSAEAPLRVMLVPTDGGTEDGTKADFAPIFNAVSRTSGLQFEIRVGQSYASVVEGMVNNLVDIAFVGPTLY